MKIRPSRGKRKIEFNSDEADLVIEMGETLKQGVASTHDDYGLLDTCVQFDAGTYGSLKLVCKTNSGEDLTEAATSHSVTDFFPAGSIVLAFMAEVTTAITGPGDWRVGTESDADAFGEDIALTLGITVSGADWTAALPLVIAAESDLVFADPDDADNITAGVVKYACWMLIPEGVD